MADTVTEDQLEIRAMKAFEQIGYTTLDAMTGEASALSDGTARTDKKQVILPDVLMESIKSINPSIPEEEIEQVVQGIINDTALNSRLLNDKNFEYYQSLIDGVLVSFKVDEKETRERVKLIDFDNPSNNSFIAARQVWIRGEVKYRRPDILVFINGLPLVWIELKKPSEKIVVGYEKNLVDQKSDIPQLFFLNQLCVVSNGHQTRAGSFNAGWQHYFEWLKEDEGDQVNRREIDDKMISLEYLIHSLMPKEQIIDYIENFVMYLNKQNKIVAKNHQFIGVNRAIDSFRNREDKNGKLGVFWHTQGSGKSFSMVLYVRKIRRKFEGNYTFLMITDREDLNTQLLKNFVKTGVIENSDHAKAKSGKELRDMLSSNTPMIFTLIQKFRYDKNESFPVLSERDDIIVIVDEAHRTQYKDLAENMRKGIPNAQYIAFTGTPLLGAKRLTNQFFGDYISEYNFADSVLDGATVPLFYTKKVPKVDLINDLLNEDFLDLIGKEELSDEEQKRLENRYGSTLNVLKRDSRLDEVAKYIVEHFPKRGFLGKGMVVSVDKFTTVKMFNKVQEQWKKRQLALNGLIKNAETQEERQALLRERNFMNNVEMAVVVSEENGEEEKFAAQGLDIATHRKRMNELDNEMRDIEEQFKDPNHPLQLVFVTAMWLTGFDAPSVSTMYLDKPMKGHTLMQAIARANRVYEDDVRGKKLNGLIIDHVNIFHYMKQALSDYATPGTDGEGEDLPVKDVEELIELLNATQDEALSFCDGLGIDIPEIANENDAFEQTRMINEAMNTILMNDKTKAQFKIYANLLKNVYDAARPEIFSYHWDRKNLKAIRYIATTIDNQIDNSIIDRVQNEVEAILDVSIASEQLKFSIKKNLTENGKVISLSDLDIENVVRKIQKSQYQNIDIAELRAFIEEKLRQMLERNETRIPFAQRYEKLVQGYNASATSNENFFEELKKFVKDLKKEDARAKAEKLSEDELVLFDLLMKDKLTKDEEKAVKSAASTLYHKLMDVGSNVLTVDWFKDEQPKQKVKNEIEDVLDEKLPDSYDKQTFEQKSNVVFSFILNRAMSGQGYLHSKVG